MVMKGRSRPAQGRFYFGDGHTLLKGEGLQTSLKWIFLAPSRKGPHFRTGPKKNLQFKPGPTLPKKMWLHFRKDQLLDLIEN